MKIFGIRFSNSIEYYLEETLLTREPGVCSQEHETSVINRLMMFPRFPGTKEEARELWKNRTITNAQIEKRQTMKKVLEDMIRKEIQNLVPKSQEDFVGAIFAGVRLGVLVEIQEAMLKIEEELK